jgi:nicotinamidase/pyrazinamidase
MSKALILIDIQKQSADTNHSDHIGHEFIENTLKLVTKCDVAEMPVIHVLTEYTQENMPLLNRQKGYKFYLKGDVTCEEIDELASSYKANHHKVIKHHYDAFYNTDLDKLLRANDIDSIIIAGLYSHWCISSAVFSALSRNLEITLVKDCIGSRYPHLDQLLTEIVWDKRCVALNVVSVDQLLVDHPR